MFSNSAAMVWRSSVVSPGFLLMCRFLWFGLLVVVIDTLPEGTAGFKVFNVCNEEVV